MNSYVQLNQSKKGFLASMWDWITSVDHKKIGILYLVTGGFYFVIAGLEALLIRLQLMFPENDLFIGSTYNELLTMHGTTMLFLVALPILYGFMNFIVPLQIGARDVAFPFLNSLGYWLYFFGGLLLNSSWFLGGAPEGGWTGYSPLTSSAAFSGIGSAYYAIGLQIAGFGTLIGAINFLATIITMRAPGMTFMRMPLFTWTTFVTSALILFAFPPLTIALFLITFDRLFGAHFFNVQFGGNVVLYEHLFWIFGHPEVYILILPAFGIFSEVISTFARKRLFGYSSLVLATFLIAFFSFMVWAHHMFTVGLGPISNTIFGIATMVIAVPTGIKIFNWLFTLWGGVIQLTTANIIALAFIPSFVAGGVTGVMLSLPAADAQFHDSYFVVAHFHYVIVGGTVLGLLAGLFYWWPKMFGKILDERLGKISFWFFFIGFHLTFLIQHFLGLWGMPRRIYTYLDGQGFNTGNYISTIGTFLMTVGVLLLVINIIITQMRGKPAPADPWNGRTLEWAVSSPPPVYNFLQIPLVRSLDAFWEEKMSGKALLPAEPLGDIHMPSNSILPFIMSVGLFIAGYGFIYQANIVGIIGLAITFICMILRSLIDDHGYHIKEEDLRKQGIIS